MYKVTRIDPQLAAILGAQTPHKDLLYGIMRTPHYERKPSRANILLTVVEDGRPAAVDGVVVAFCRSPQTR
jgi:hypothetical protein